MKGKRQRERRIVGKKVSMDYSLLFIIIFLLCFGLVMLYSTSSYNALIKFKDPAYYLKTQILATILGLIVMFAAKLDYHMYVKMAALVYIASLVCLVLVKTPLGIEANGARRWIAVGPVSFQPAELAKIGIIMILAINITNMRKRLDNFVVIIKLFLLAIPPVALILLLTKNMSSAIIVAGIAAVMLFVASPKYKPFVIIGVTAAALLALVLFSAQTSEWSEYRHGRIRRRTQAERHFRPYSHFMP